MSAASAVVSEECVRSRAGAFLQQSMPSLPVAACMDRSAACAAPGVIVARIERVEDLGQIGHDALELDLRPMDEPCAAGAIPLETVDLALRPRALDDQAPAARLRTLRRVADVAGQQEDVAIVQRDALDPVAIDDEQARIPLELVE